MAPVIEPLGPETARDQREPLEALYYAAFSPPPYAESLAEAQAFGALLDRDSRRPGFVGFIARDEKGSPVGLVYGYDTPAEAPDGAWWGRLLAAVGPDRAGEWILGQFAFCWFAVLPQLQGLGVGSRLYDAVMASVPAPGPGS